MNDEIPLSPEYADILSMMTAVTSAVVINTSKHARLMLSWLHTIRLIVTPDSIFHFSALIIGNNRRHFVGRDDARISSSKLKPVTSSAVRTKYRIVKPVLSKH